LNILSCLFDITAPKNGHALSSETGMPTLRSSNSLKKLLRAFDLHSSEASFLLLCKLKWQSEPIDLIGSHELIIYYYNISILCFIKMHF